MNIKEIAPKLTQKLSIAINDDEAVEFAEALIAELAKQNEPVGWYSKQYGFCYMHKQPDQFKVGSILYLKDGTPAWRIESACSKTALINMANIPHGTVFYEEVTIPPTASQIEQETAEAWISVDEQMPNNKQTVLVLYTTHWGKQAVTIGWHTRAKCLDASNFEGEVNDEYDEEADTYYMKEQWVDESVESEYHYPIQNVTHWMPLPEAPKGEQK